MAIKKNNAARVLQVGLRLKPRLHAHIAAEAKRAGISLNAEIVRRLEVSLHGDILAEILRRKMRGARGK